MMANHQNSTSKSWNINQINRHRRRIRKCWNNVGKNCIKNTERLRSPLENSTYHFRRHIVLTDSLLIYLAWSPIRSFELTPFPGSFIPLVTVTTMMTNRQHSTFFFWKTYQSNSAVYKKTRFWKTSTYLTYPHSRRRWFAHSLACQSYFSLSCWSSVCRWMHWQQQQSHHFNRKPTLRRIYARSVQTHNILLSWL